MKKLFSIIFFVVGFAGLTLAGPLTNVLSAEAVSLITVVGFVGFFFSVADMKQAKFHNSNHAYLTVVPAKIVAPNPAQMAAQGLQEVPPMTRAEKALFDFLRAKSNQVTYDAIQSGAISFDPISYVIRANITNLSGRQKILGANTLYSLGISSFPNGAVLPQYYNFCFDRIAVRYAVLNNVNASPSQTAGYSSVGSAMDPALRNGNLIVNSNRNAIIETPIIDFISQAAVTGGGIREYDGGILEKPRFFLEMLQIEVELDLAGAIATPANNISLTEVVFSGVQARLKY